MRRGEKYFRKEFESWMIEAAQLHVDQGYSYGSFAGKYNIDPALWREWTKKIWNLKQINKHYLTRLSGKKRFSCANLR